MFIRDWSLIVGSTRYTDPLRVVFHSKRTIKPQPNTLDLEIYNLSDSSRLALEKAESLPCILEAGYRDEGVSSIFRGDVRSITTQWTGPDSKTTLSSGDGEKAIRGKRVRVFLGPQTLTTTVLTELANALGLAPGNLGPVQAALNARGQAVMFPRGVALQGNAWREMQTLARSADLDISVQDGALLILDRGKTLDQRAVVLTEDFGLEGSPSVDADGTIGFQAKILPDLRPGVLIQMNARAVKGLYRLEHVEAHGDTAGTDWGMTCHARPLNLPLKDARGF